MKRKHKIIGIISLLLPIFVVNGSAAFAMRPQQFGAWIAAALQALTISTSAAAYQVADASRDLMDWLSHPVKVVASEFVDVPYTTPLTNVDEYLSRSTLQIDKDIVTIDGVDYTDVWLSNDAAEIFRVNAFDIENAFDIASQSEGVFASGWGKVFDVPIYNVNGVNKSQTYTIPASIPTLPESYLIGSMQYSRVPVSETQVSQSVYYPDEYSRSNTYAGGDTNCQISQSGTRFVVRWTGNGIMNLNHNVDSNTEWVVQDPFEFDWVSGTIPVDQELPENTGLRIRVPTDDIEQWYTDYPSTGDSVVINLGDPELTAKVDDLIDLIIPLIPILDIDFSEKETPAPDPEPVPDPEPYPDPLPDPSISLIDSTLKDIIQALKNIYDSIALGNTFSEAIKNLNDKINWSLDEIKEKIGDLADRIERGSADWFRDIVDSIWQPFLPILNIFRAGVGIWHYVIEWLQYIHAPFVTFWNFLGSAGYIFISPIYAAAAAAIVIAIYRRFGR